jgi:hypothetical protein
MTRRIVYRTFYMTETGTLFPVVDKNWDYGEYSSPEEAQNHIRELDDGDDPNDIFIIPVSVVR